MIADRIITITGFIIMGVLLYLVALQNVKIAQIAAEVAALIVKTH